MARRYFPGRLLGGWSRTDNKANLSPAELNCCWLLGWTRYLSAHEYIINRAGFRGGHSGHVPMGPHKLELGLYFNTYWLDKVVIKKRCHHFAVFILLDTVGYLKIWSFSSWFVCTFFHLGAPIRLNPALIVNMFKIKSLDWRGKIRSIYNIYVPLNKSKWPV